MFWTNRQNYKDGELIWQKRLDDITELTEA